MPARPGALEDSAAPASVGRPTHPPFVLVHVIRLADGRVHFIEGRVERTLPDRAPAEIALLRLDTDWYESTRHELVHLYPRLSAGGVLIIDDYGHFAGARRATDEYFARNPMLLSRIDYTGRLAVKPG